MNTNFEQMGKSNHLKFNDQNTRYFHLVAKIKNFENKMTKFQNMNGVLVSEDKIKISKEITLELCSRFITERFGLPFIKETLFELPYDKSLGLDEYPTKFF